MSNINSLSQIDLQRGNKSSLFIVIVRIKYKLKQQKRGQCICHPSDCNSPYSVCQAQYSVLVCNRRCLF